ncbi:helix-hairpin-helix domain-containing protein [Streptomyces hirsutus]|uniref:helix-hairpin-helix domain-containing protein n=1 Tax=Streptomyces hirsutus TaxID=35620 RepID=UPI003F4D9F5B
MVRPDEEVEALLQEDADLIAVTGGEAFKARAYEKAARSIGGCSSPHGAIPRSRRSPSCRGSARSPP